MTTPSSIRSLTPRDRSDREPVPAAGPDRMPPPRLQQVRMYAFDEVKVLEATGRLSEVAEELDLAIQLALADVPRGVVCDLSAVLEGAEQDALELLATSGRHVRDWPAIPVAVVSPDPQVRAALRAHPLGAQLIVDSSMLPVLAAVLATPAPAVERLRLSPNPTAARASRDFVTRALLKWRLGGVTHSVCLVASELVTNSTVHARTDIEVTIAWNQAALRLTVRDRSPDRPRQVSSHLDRHMRGLAIATGLSRAFGVLPTRDGGKVVWAVFDVPQPRSSTRPRRAPPVGDWGTRPPTAPKLTLARDTVARATAAREDRPQDVPPEPYDDSSNYLG